MDPQHLQCTQSQSQSQYLHNINFNGLTLQDDWMLPFSSTCHSSLPQSSEQHDCNQTVESYKEWTPFPNHADSWLLQPVVDQQRSRNLLEENSPNSTMVHAVENSPRAISIPQSRSSDRMRAERSASRFTPEINFPSSPVSAPSIAQSWDLSSYKPGQIKRHAAMQMMESRLSGHSLTDTSSGTSFDSTIDPHMLSYEFSSINTSFTDPIQGPLSGDPARLWKKLSIEEINRNAANVQKKRSFETFSEACGNCEPWSLAYLRAMGVGQNRPTQSETALDGANQSWLASVIDTNQALEESQYTYENIPSHSRESWASGEYVLVPSPNQMPAMTMERLEDVPAFSLPEIQFPSTCATTLARTSTVIHSPIPAVPRSPNLTSDTHTYKKVCHTARSTLSPEPVPRSVPFSNTNSPTLQPTLSPNRRREIEKEVPSSCEICSKLFSRQRDKRRHQDQIHGKKVAAVCVISATNSCGCNRSFKRAEHLRSHLKTVAKRRDAEEKMRLDSMMLSQQCA